MKPPRGRPAGTTDDNQSTILKREIKEGMRLMKDIRGTLTEQLVELRKALADKSLAPEKRVEIMQALAGMISLMSKSISESSKVLTKETPEEGEVDLEALLLGR